MRALSAIIMTASMTAGALLAACGDIDAGPCAAGGCLDAGPADRDPPDRPEPDSAPSGAPDAHDAGPPDHDPPDAWRPSDLGPPPGPVDRERSLVWTRPDILDDPSRVSLSRVMAAAAEDLHGGHLFDHVLRRFGTTDFSRRPDQALIADALREDQGDDPGQWDLDAAPFIATGVHLRVDLADGAHCGELRVSFSTTHATVQPLHFIFLFEMRPEPGHRDCRGLMVRLARLSELDDAAFLDAADALLDTHLTPDRFLLMESGEFTIFPWEWRQWTKAPNPDPVAAETLPVVLENPPLFQTVDVEGINRGGERRRAFLRWVEDNAAAIDARTALIPEEFRAPWGTAPTAIPRVPLSLRDLDPAVAARYPELREKLEIIGCPVCHTADADFVQTTPERTFSEFYDKELDARADFLDRWIRTGRKPPVPYGPLQPDPVLPD